MSSSRTKNPQHVGALLGAISLTSLQGGRPGIYLAPFLLLQGFNESNIGVVLFIGGIVKLLSQPVAGILIDRASDKRWLLLLGNTLVIAACIAIYINTSNVMFGTIAIGVGESITFPALYSLTLGLISSSNSSNSSNSKDDDDEGEALKRQIAFNESCQHLGNLLFAVMAGVLVLWYPADASLFLLVVAGMGLAASVLTLFIDNSLVDQHAARGGRRGHLTAGGGGGGAAAAAAINNAAVAAVVSNPLVGKKDEETDTEAAAAAAAAVPDPPLSLSILLGRADILGFLAIILLFHLGNAAMLPLLAQKLTLSYGENGIMFTSLSIVIAQACMYISSSMFPRCLQSVGINQALLVALLCIPVRGALILMLLVHMPSVALLLLTQILDGLAGGVMGCVLVLGSARLAAGTQRFSFLTSTAKLCEAGGGAASNLLGESIAWSGGYGTAFAVLGAIGVLPVCLMHSTSVSDALETPQEHAARITRKYDDTIIPKYRPVTTTSD